MVSSKRGETPRKLAVYDREKRKTIDREITDQAIDFMKRQAEAEQPFLAYLPYTQPKPTNLLTRTPISRTRPAMGVSPMCLPKRMRMWANSSIRLMNWGSTGPVGDHQGYSRNTPAERMARDARMFTIGGGTAQILRTVIASEGHTARRKLLGSATGTPGQGTHLPGHTP